MIINDRITSYIHSLERDNTAFLEELRRQAEADDVPIIRREMESFIRVLLKMAEPKSILEIGSGVAYSTIFMAENSDADILTLEKYDKRISQAKQNIKASGYENRITLIEEDAVDFLAENRRQFDLIFLDAAKGQYIEMLSDIMRTLKKGSVLLADNVLQNGEITDSRFAMERRQRTIHERMREFLWEIKHNDGLETSIITIGDGVSLSIRK